MFARRRPHPDLASRLAALSTLLIVCLPLRAAQHWIRLTTPHFEMYTTNSAASGTKALETFERVRSFFLENSPSKTAPDTPVRIVAFRSEKEFQPYRPNSGALAFYQRSRKRDYIVMQDLQTENYRTAVHEYTHLIVEHAGLKLPVWLNEGLADLYSSLEPKGNQTMVGRPIASHAMVLASQKWLDLKLLTSVQMDSPYYNEREKMALFYAESWALTHMLALSKPYSGGFARFLTSAAAGESAEASFESVYGKTLAQVREDLGKYFNQRTVLVSIFNIKLEKVNLEPQVAELSDLDTELALTDLLSSQPNKAAQAKERLDRIAAEYPENAEVEESLGYFAWQNGDVSIAEAHFAKAIDKGTTDPEMLYQYASLIGSDPGKIDLSIAALRKALAVKPAYAEAQYNLGLQEVNAHLYGAALSTLLGLKQIKPEQAFTVYSSLAYCTLQLKSPAQARTWAKRAQEYAKTPAEEEQVNGLVVYLDQQEAANSAPAKQLLTNTEPQPTVDDTPQPWHPRTVRKEESELSRATGIAKALECHGTALRLHVVIDNKEKIFAIRNPKDIVVRNTKEGYVDFACGALKPVPITVLFVPDKTGTGAGQVRELEF